MTNINSTELNLHIESNQSVGFCLYKFLGK